MYFLSKFCRICIQTEVTLSDIDTIDIDGVKLSEKLEACTRMVVTRESLSSEICLKCIAKLRVSYEFNNMCKKSSKKLHGYFRAIIAKSHKKITPENFVNTELNVFVTPLREYDNCGISRDLKTSNDIVENHQKELFCHKEKRKRITKEQRCSLLKRLLTSTQTQSLPKQTEKFAPEQEFYTETLQDGKGGLKNIIRFTKNYEFGLKVDKNSNETTPLDKLKSFSNEFFRRDFSEFKNTVLYIIENRNNLLESDDSEDEFFNNPEEDNLNDNLVKFEEVIIEPDLKIKTELDYEEDGECLASDYCDQYEEQMEPKTEIKEEQDEFLSSNHEFSDYECSLPEYLPNCSENTVCAYPPHDSMHFLNNFVGSYAHSAKRTFSPSNVRCRTRDNPYINPLLKHQFLYRSFKCQKCSRYFKSPGYLKAHNSKVH